jgi:hypothetical protein
LVLALLGLGVFPTSAEAQWTTQTIQLQPGWNAVFLEIEPEPRDCDSQLSALPIESVWAWNRRFSSVQFIQDPTTLVPGQEDWLAWLPPAHPGRAALNLHILQGAKPYLIKLPDAAPATSWQIKGQPVVRTTEWISDSLNLVGFAIDAAKPPTFQELFASSAAHSGQPVYRLNTAGRWEAVTAPATTPLRAGEAFWIQTLGVSRFQGPIEVQMEQRTGLDFGRTLTEQTLRLRNASSQSRKLRVQRLPSLSPPTDDTPAYAGEVPLGYYTIDVATQRPVWLPMPAALEITLAAGEEWALRVEVRRAEMTPFNPPQGVTDVLYQSLLQVSDDRGTRWLLPVTARGLQTFSPAAPAAAPPSGTAPQSVHARAGLWVGSAVISAVNQPANVGQPTLPVATASEFQIRLIVHVDAAGQAQLLQKVIQMWKNGTTKPDPTDPTNQVVDEPGRPVLLTDESLAGSYSGASLRDGQPVGRRVSSAAFGFRQPIAMTGAGAFGANTISCMVPLEFDDAVNPFKHKYHPDHDNLDGGFGKKVAEGIESFTVTRRIELEFQAVDPEGLPLSGWGDNQLGGIYRETITGLHQDPLFVRGTFRLRHASRVAALNDGQ